MRSHDILIKIQRIYKRGIHWIFIKIQMHYKGDFHEILNKIQIIETSNSAKELYSKLENKEVFVQFIYDDINKYF